MVLKITALILNDADLGLFFSAQCITPRWGFQARRDVGALPRHLSEQDKLEPREFRHE